MSAKRAGERRVESLCFVYINQIIKGKRRNCAKMTQDVASCFLISFCLCEGCCLF